MDFELSADQKLLFDNAGAYVRKESPITRARHLREDPLGFSKAAWKQLAELGWLAIPFEEDVGGLGWSFVEVALVSEQLGTTLVPEPYLSSVVLAGTAIASAATKAQQKALLEPMIAGDTTLALAYAERGSRHDHASMQTRAEKKGARYALTGEKVFVLDGHAADHLIVAARTGEGVSLFSVPRGAGGTVLTPLKTMDGRRAAHLRLDGAEGELLGDEGAGLSALERALDHGAAAACAEGYGIMRTVLWMTVNYLQQREQFGVKIGNFQALQHRAVDMFVETELARSTSILAALKVSSSDETERKSQISAAKVQLAQSGKFVTQQGIQLHGGIGITDEHDVGLYFKRMTVLNALFGDEEFHLARYAQLPSFTAGLAG